MKNQIQLKNIKFRNIFSYGNKWNTFDFKTGISFISGKNVSTNRRNFTGKSSFLRIIPFALFGKVEGVNKKQIVNWKNKKQTEVILIFEKNESQYIIHRGIKPDIFNVTKDGVEIPQSSNKTVFQQEIEDTVLQMDFNTFMNIVYCDTNNSNSILNASKPIKRSYIEKLFNLSYFTNLKDIATKKKKSINTKITEIDSDIKSYTSKIELSKENNKKYESDIRRYIDDKDILKKGIKPESDIIDFTEKIKDLRIKQDKVDKGLYEKKALLLKIKAKSFYLSKFKVEEKTSQEYIGIIEERININNKQIIKIQSQIDKIDVYNIDACVEEAKIELDELKDELKEKTFNHITLTKEINKLEKELKSKPKNGKCPTCLQKVDFKHIKKEFNSILKKRKTLLLSLITDLGDIDSDIIESTENYDKFKLKRSDFDKKNNELSEFKSLQITNEQNLETNIKLLKEQNKVERFQSANKKLNILSDKINKEIDNVPSYYSEILDFETQMTVYETLYKERLRMIEQLKGIDSKILSVEGYIRDTTTQINTDISYLDENDRKLKKYNDMMEYVKQVIILCGDDKCKQYAISNFLPFFNERINYYLSKSGVLFYIKLSGWLDYDILGPGISNCSYSNLSGAERISLDRAMQLASMDIKKSQSNSLIDVLILDEVLDSSVDDIGLGDMMEIIKAKQTDDNSKVLIVSHRVKLGSLTDSFDYKYMVTMDKYSSIKEI